MQPWPSCAFKSRGKDTHRTSTCAGSCGKVQPWNVHTHGSAQGNTLDLVGKEGLAKDGRGREECGAKISGRGSSLEGGSGRAGGREPGLGTGSSQDARKGEAKREA